MHSNYSVGTRILNTFALMCQKTRHSQQGLRLLTVQDRVKYGDMMIKFPDQLNLGVILKAQSIFYWHLLTL